MAEPWYSGIFPSLNSVNHCITSPRTNRYNCVAWAAGFDNDWWWPEGGYFWPQYAPREASMNAFLILFGGLGYERCNFHEPENGYERIAIFSKIRYGRQLPSHVSRQLSNGHWTSKLGKAEDIIHQKVSDVSGSVYGYPKMYMKRKIQHQNIQQHSPSIRWG